MKNLGHVLDSHIKEKNKIQKENINYINYKNFDYN